MEHQGPFDRILQTEPAPPRDRAAAVIVALVIALGLILLILVLPPVSIFSGDGPSDATAALGPVATRLADETPAPPDGFDLVSPLYRLTGAQEGDLGPLPITLTLSSPLPAGEPLVFFTYEDGVWKRLADAVAVGEGDVAQGEVPFLPATIAVLRAKGTSRRAIGVLPAGSELNPEAVPALTELHVAGLVPLSDGSLAGQMPPLPDGLLLPVVPTISTPTQVEVDALNTILASPDLRARHAQVIADFVLQGDFAGVHLDYRRIDPTLADQFTAFVRTLSETLRSQGRTVTLTLPAPAQRADGWDTFGYQWEALAPLVDAFQVTAAVAPDQYYPFVEAALGYLVSRVGGDALLLTIRPLSYERSVDGLRPLTLRDALTLASTPTAEATDPVAPGASVRLLAQNLAPERGATGLVWDEAARAVSFTYTGAGGQRTVWLGNEFSEAFRLDLARRYGLGGVAIDDVSLAAADARIWPAVQRFVTSGEVDLLRPNDALLEPQWAASGGVLEDGAGPVRTWQAPAEPGSYTLTLIVSDGVVRVGQQLRLDVVAPTGPEAP